MLKSELVAVISNSLSAIGMTDITARRPMDVDNIIHIQFTLPSTRRMLLHVEIREDEYAFRLVDAGFPIIAFTGELYYLLYRTQQAILNP